MLTVVLIVTVVVKSRRRHHPHIEGEMTLFYYLTLSQAGACLLLI